MSILCYAAPACAPPPDRQAPTTTVAPTPRADPGAEGSLPGSWEVALVGDSGRAFVSDIALTLQEQGGQITGTWRNPATPEPRVVRSTDRAANVVTFSVPEEGLTFLLDLNAEDGALSGTATVTRADGRVVAAYRIEGRSSTDRSERPAVATIAATPIDILDIERDRQDIPGIVAAFEFGDGRSAVIASGLADRRSEEAMPTTARMPAGSVGKTFVAAAVLRLVDDGVLDLDDPVARWLGDAPWYARLPNGDEITVRTLLDHSSGVPDHVYDSDFTARVAEAVESADSTLSLTPEQLVGFVLDDEPLFAPGMGYGYTDTGFVLAGLVIEAAHGVALFDLIDRAFLEPLGLDLTAAADRRRIPGIVPGYLDEANRLGLPTEIVQRGTLIFDPSLEWAGGGIVSNAADLAHWIRLLATGSIPGVDTTRMVTETNPTDPSVGLGLMISETALGTAYGHAGTFPGYRTSVLYWEDHDLAVAVQANADWADTGRIAIELARILTAADR